MKAGMERRMRVIEQAVRSRTEKRSLVIAYKKNLDGTFSLNGATYNTASELIETYEREHNCRVPGSIVLVPSPKRDK
jgi:hypothetical protein